MEGESHIKPVEVSDGVISAIKSGKAKMRPRWRFALETWLMAVGGVILLLILVYLVGFIDFGLYESGLMALPDFGFAGWYELIWSLPWALISLSAIFIILLAVLIRRYSFGYTRPLVYSLLGILFLIVGGGMIIAQPSFSRAVFSDGPNARVPFVSWFYSGFGVPESINVHHGIVLSTTTGGFILQDLYDRTSSVILDLDTRMPNGNNFDIGETVVVFGNAVGTGTIRAIGIEHD